MTVGVALATLGVAVVGGLAAAAWHALGRRIDEASHRGGQSW